jgi:putative FmdB family regulatory protein
VPTYTFNCARCGDFTEIRGMQLADAPATCPLCGRTAQRVFLVPYITRMNPAIRRAHERNERSAHEPRVVSADDWHRERKLAGSSGARVQGLHKHH